MTRIYEELLEEAKLAARNSYSPYSCFPVGACALYESGNKYTGCNVENVSYGLALCAERNAISNAIAQGEKTKIVAIAVYSTKQTRCLPCGACRQWMNEFAINSTDMKVILEDDNKNPLILTLEDINY